MLFLLTSALAQQPAQSHYITMSGLKHLHGAAYDEVNDQMFVTDAELGVVRRYDNFSTASPNSTISHSVSLTAGGGLQGAAYDPTNERVYFLRSGTLFYANRSLSVQGNFSPGLGTSVSDVAWRQDELYILESDGSGTIKVYDTATHTHQRSITAPSAQGWPSLAYDEHQDVFWFSYWNGGSPTSWWAIDPTSGSSTQYSAVSGGYWGHGAEYNDGYIYLSTETQSTDGLRVLTVDCDDDSDGSCNADDNCPSTSNSSQSDVDADGEGDACDSCTDVDGDGYGDTSYSATTCTEDCDDSDNSIYPGADEYCDGVDNDCNNDIDEDDAVDVSTWYADDDGDGYGNASDDDIDCLQPSGFVSDDSDCDDSDASIYPSASELCDGQINDCSSSSLPAVESDDDGDGYVDCSVDSGGWDGSAITGGDDCDDADSTVHPSASELCDGQLNDCDSSLSGDEIDNDGDGYVECVVDSGGWDGSAINGGEDCDDSDADTWPGADEYCDGHDDDCDEEIDEDDSVDASTWYADVDGDWYGNAAVSEVSCYQTSGWVADDTDCDDADASSYPGAGEVPYDGIDQDCDGEDLCDVDGDTWDAEECGGEDCDDDDDAIYPGADDPWYDGIDSDCAENSDFDADGDGYDSKSYGGEDCDDADAETYPGAPDEPGDGVVTDCDSADEYDADGDGFDGSDYGGSDCDDANSDINPGADEVWYDGVDQDCDGNDDDQDGDGWALADDCDDTNAQIYVCDTALDSGLSGGSAKGGGGCGCDGTGGAGGLLGLLLLALTRRRQR